MFAGIRPIAPVFGHGFVMHLPEGGADLMLIQQLPALEIYDLHGYTHLTHKALFAGLFGRRGKCQRRFCG